MLRFGNPKPYLIEVYLSKREYEKAIPYCHEAISVGEQEGFLPSMIKLFKILSARAKVMTGERDIDPESLCLYATQNRYKNLEGHERRYIGEILLNIDDMHLAEAENWIRKAIEADRTNGTRFDLGMDHLSYAELLKRKGDITAARENLLNAAAIFKECGADGWEQKAQELLNSL